MDEQRETPPELTVEPPPGSAGSDPHYEDTGASPAPPMPTGMEPCNCGRPDGRCVCGKTYDEDRPETIGPSYVYALGTIDPRFPSLAVEKEFAQVTGRAETANLTDREALHKVLSDPQNRYLVRQLCYVLTVEGIETYVLRPGDPVDFGLLVEAIRPVPRPTDLDIAIGVRGPLSPPELCNGLVIPILIFDQIYSFDIDSIVKSIPRPEGVKAQRFEAAATELLMTILQMADNAGATDEHRALNFLAIRYPPIYEKTAEAFGRNASLSAVDVRRSALSGVRRIVDVIFSFTDRQTDVTDKFFVRVDVTETFPFIVTKLSPYFDF